MFQFTYRLKIAERVKAKCERHPRYNPQQDGEAASKADVPPASPCSTSITHGSHSKPLTATSSASPRPGHRFVSSEPSRLRSMRNAGRRPATTIEAGESRFPPLHPSLAGNTSHR